MTIIRLADRVARLELRRNPPSPDPRIAAEAREIVLHRVLGIAAALDRGGEPNNLVGHALVEFDGDLVAALEAVVARRRLQ